MDEAERTARAEFDREYRTTRDPIRQRIERSVLGSDYGANGYTTIDQADQLAAELRLGPGMTLLDLGAGSGWPGLYLAAATGCGVVLTDQPMEGLRSAKVRAVEDRTDDRCSVVQSSGDALPLRNGVFDAVTHTDVLC